jgi:hypothetical protein
VQRAPHWQSQTIPDALQDVAPVSRRRFQIQETAKLRFEALGIEVALQAAVLGDGYLAGLLGDHHRDRF